MVDQTIEYLKLETEILKLTTFASLAIGGGTVGLILGEPTVLRLLFAGSGLLVTIGGIATLWRQGQALRARIAIIQEN